MQGKVGKGLLAHSPFPAPDTLPVAKCILKGQGLVTMKKIRVYCTIIL
jgi:hypothetical protein